MEGDKVIDQDGQPEPELIGSPSPEDWFECRLETDSRLLGRIASARAELRAGRGVRLEDTDLYPPRLRSARPAPYPWPMPHDPASEPPSPAAATAAGGAPASGAAAPSAARQARVSPGGAADKHGAVRDMFGRIAGRYDLMNRVMTGGLDGAWRRGTVRAARVPAGGRVLDVGTGTGDLALEIARLHPDATVVGLDYTGPMIARAPAKALREGLGERISWARADGHVLPFPDASFDAVTSAFVLRNFADLAEAYKEMARVVKPGGRVVALEISPESHPLWRPLFRLHFERVVPLVGRLVTGDDSAYRYLPASVAAFLGAEALGQTQRAAGLVPLPPRRLMLGSLMIHIGLRPPQDA